MHNYRKQHIVSKTYLKHFSINSDGKELFVIDNEDQYKNGIQKRNAGDRIFWEENYSDTCMYKDTKAIEKMFGNEIEPRYNEIIAAIEDQSISINIKEKLIRWIFYSKMRSPIWEETSRGRENKWTSKNRYSQQLHLENFVNEDRFKSALEKFVTDAINKRWTVYKSPIGKYWWTSDNPGYCIDLMKFDSDKSLIPDPFCNLSGVDAVLFYPLTKFFCLNIHAYDYGEDVKLNLTNTDVSFATAEMPSYNTINYCTLISQRRLIISPEIESLKIVEQVKKGIK